MDGGSVDNDEIYELQPMPRTSSMAGQEEEGSIVRVNDDSEEQVSEFNLAPFEV